MHRMLRYRYCLVRDIPILRQNRLILLLDLYFFAYIFYTPELYLELYPDKLNLIPDIRDDRGCLFRSFLNTIDR